MKEKSIKGITLVALVITIVILLILAGISIQAITNTGLFANAKIAKEKSIEGQLKEEISLAIKNIQVEEIAKGNGVTLETLAGGQLEKELKDITAELTDGEINGEYKDYEYTIDSNLNVTINGPVTGARIKGSAEVQTGYVFEGGTVEIKVTASITEGTITGIEVPDGVTLKTDTSTTEKVYTVNKNGIYTFKITSDSGKTKNIIAKVENILSAPQIKIVEVLGTSFKINIENNYPEGVITEYKYYVGDEVKKEKTTNKSYTVTELIPITKYSNIKAIAYINNIEKESNLEEITTKNDLIEYSWEEIAEIAKAISNDTSITDDSVTATATVNGVQKTLNVGDRTKLDGKTVRILGFNHDELVEPTTAYGSSTVTEKAGISFEYVDFLTSTRMNSSDTNSGGWKETELREILNGTAYNSLITTYHIKKVKKDYIPTYNIASTQQTEDYLWLLSCGEIWDNGIVGGISRGYAVATEGKQYKYYKVNLENVKFNNSSNITNKPNVSNPNMWWLRSPRCYFNSDFCMLYSRKLQQFYCK